MARIIDGDGDSYRVGTPQDDFMDGRGGNDDLYGVEGDDEVYGGRGDDDVDGGPGDDLVDGGPGLDLVTGGEGFDILRGRAGDDTLDLGDDGGWARGDRGDDTLRAWDGPYSRLDGGTGDDECWTSCEREDQGFEVVTGRGEDTVVFNAALDGHFGQAHVRDFAQGSDELSLQLRLPVPGQPGLVQTVPAAEVLGWLDGTDPASGFASSFALGSGEHGIGIWLGDDALVCTYHRGSVALAGSRRSLARCLPIRRRG
jgi:Ca2+-binding RTX toxin-like protein